MLYWFCCIWSEKKFSSFCICFTGFEISDLGFAAFAQKRFCYFWIDGVVSAKVGVL